MKNRLVNELISEFQALANPKKARLLQRYFKTGKGQYGEGDVFLGINVPKTRKIAKKYSNKINLSESENLIYNKIHEIRLAGLLILVHQYQKANKAVKKEIYDFYLKHSKQINNWDLVDLTAPRIVGDYLSDKSDKRNILYQLANSENLWQKRISIISTFAFIQDNQLKDTLKISEILLKDKHDLIHKAVGWALREMGKKNKKVLISFLNKHYKNIPRTTLRYAIEKFPEKERKKWLTKDKK